MIQIVILSLTISSFLEHFLEKKDKKKKQNSFDWKILKCGVGEIFGKEASFKRMPKLWVYVLGNSFWEVYGNTDYVNSNQASYTK